MSTFEKELLTTAMIDHNTHKYLYRHPQAAVYTFTMWTSYVLFIQGKCHETLAAMYIVKFC